MKTRGKSDRNLEPLKEDQAKEIKKEAQDIINKKFQDGIDDIEIMRSKMTKEMEKSRAAMNLASELNAKQKSKELMNKIIDETKDIAKVESEPKFEGKQMVMIIQPI